MAPAKTNLSLPAKSLREIVVEQLASVKFAVTVVVIIAVACIAGTIRPQWKVYYSWWFVGLLCTLSASIVVCSSRRFATVLRTTGYARGRALGSLITHISFLLILTGAVIRGVWGEKGVLEFREGQTVAQYVIDREVKPLPFAVHLTKFEVETYDKPAESTLLVAQPEKNLSATLPVQLDAEQKFGEFTIKILEYVPDFVVDLETREIKTRSNEPRNPAIFVAVNSPT